MLFKQNKSKKKWWLPIAIALLLFMIFYKNHTLFSTFNNMLLPIRTTVYKTSDNIHEYLHSFSNIIEVNKKNRELTQKIEKQNNIFLENKELTKENEKLRSLLELKKREKDHVVIAKIEFIDALNPYNSITLNKGSDDGIEKNMAVISTLGVVGRIKEVFTDHSIVELITSTTSYTSTTNKNNTTLGVLNGQDSNILTLEYVVRDDKVNIGDKVFTSGVSDIYRKNLYLGEITSISNKDEMFEEITVKLPYNIFNLKYVMVLKKGG